MYEDPRETGTVSLFPPVILGVLAFLMVFVAGMATYSWFFCKVM